MGDLGKIGSSRPVSRADRSVTRTPSRKQRVDPGAEWFAPVERGQVGAGGRWRRRRACRIAGSTALGRSGCWRSCSRYRRPAWAQGPNVETQVPDHDADAGFEPVAAGAKARGWRDDPGNPAGPGRVAAGSGRARRRRGFRRRSRAPARRTRFGPPRASRAPEPLPVPRAPSTGSWRCRPGKTARAPPTGLTLDQAIERLLQEQLRPQVQVMEIPQARPTS